jgi:ATP-dependent Lon protease
MKTIFEELRVEHDKQRELLSELIETSGESEKRKEIFQKLKVELKEHSKHEERALYRPMLEHDNTQQKARHSIAEHKDIDDLVSKLEETSMDTNAWLMIAKDLSHKVHHHLEEEEKEVFVSAGIEFNKLEKIYQGQKYKSGVKDDLRKTDGSN